MGFMCLGGLHGVFTGVEVCVFLNLEKHKFVIKKMAEAQISTTRIQNSMSHMDEIKVYTG